MSELPTPLQIALGAGVKPSSLRTAVAKIIEDGYHFAKHRQKYYLAVPNMGAVTGNRSMTNKLRDALLPQFKFRRRVLKDGYPMDIFEPIDPELLQDWLNQLKMLSDESATDGR